jgi:SEC-C motif
MRYSPGAVEVAIISLTEPRNRVYLLRTPSPRGRYYMVKRPITLSELQAHLEQQLGFLERSAASFDEGYESEAKRLAVTLRVLLHDTPKSHSLLGQLGKADQAFADTALDFDPTNPVPHGGLVFEALGPPKTRHVALLDDAPVCGSTPFHAWWTAPLFVDNERKILTRRDLILVAANQDGGAHVDPALDETYDKLSRLNSMGLFAVENGEARPMDGPERAAIRQITHEVLKTLKPGYEKRPSHQAGVIIGGISVVIEKTAAGQPRPAAAKAATRKIGRNERCPCGSGKKYKHCCGRLAA